MGRLLGFLALGAIVACGALSGPVAACDGVAQFRSDYCAPQLVAAYAAPLVVPQPPPTVFYRQEAFVAPPQPVVAAYAQSYSAPVAFSAGYSQAFAAGPPVALRGRFAGNPAYGGAAQLNFNAGVSRERVARQTLFKRKVGPSLAPVGIVGAGQLVQPY
jgi:hypothetical protein